MFLIGSTSGQKARIFDTAHAPLPPPGFRRLCRIYEKSKNRRRLLEARCLLKRTKGFAVHSVGGATRIANLRWKFYKT